MYDKTRKASNFLHRYYSDFSQELKSKDTLAYLLINANLEIPNAFFEMYTKKVYA